MDTNSTVYVAQVIDSLYESDEGKVWCCGLFADSVDRADSNGKDRWAVTLFPDRIRLIVGHVILAVLVKHGIWLSLDEDAVDSQWTG